MNLCGFWGFFGGDSHTALLLSSLRACLPPPFIPPRANRDNHGLKLNRLASIGSAQGFGDLSALRELELSYNLLSALPDGLFSGMSRLELLGLARNRLTSLPTGMFDGLSSLQRLFLESNGLTSVGPAAAFRDLAGLTILGLRLNLLTALPELDQSTRLLKLFLDGNRFTALGPGQPFRQLALLQSLTLDENRLSSLPAGVFAGLVALTSLQLHHNQLPYLERGLFDGMPGLDSLGLHANRFTAAAPAAFTFPSMYTGLRGVHDNAASTPRFTYSPNPLECALSAGGSVWNGTGAIDCQTCTQGHRRASAASPGSGHAVCHLPDFELNPDPTSPAQRVVANLAARLRATAYIGEELDLYAGVLPALHDFEPKAAAFFGWHAGGQGWNDIRFSVHVGDGVDISCGSTIAGDLSDPDTTVPSRIRMPNPRWPSYSPQFLFESRQRLLRLEVLDDASSFNFSSCNSNLATSIAVYNGTAGGGNATASLIGAIVAGAIDFYSRDNRTLPARFSCPLSASGRLTNVVLDRGHYLLAVQPHPFQPTPEPGQGLFEVAMACNGDQRAAATAMPVDPSDGGVTIDPATGRLTVALEHGARPGVYNMTVLATDGAGYVAHILRRPVEIGVRPPFAIRTAVSEPAISPGCSGEHDRIRSEAAAATFHFDRTTVVAGFDPQRCPVDGLFGNYSHDDAARISFELRLSQAHSTTMPDVYANADTGRVLINPPAEAALGADTHFEAELVALDGAGQTLRIANWSVNVEPLPALPVLSAAGAAPSDAFQPHEAYATRADGMLALARSTWAIGRVYQLPPITVRCSDAAAVDPDTVRFTYEPQPPGFFLNARTGEVLGRPRNAPLHHNASRTSTLYAVAEGFAPAPIGTFFFEYRHADTSPEMSGAAVEVNGAACRPDQRIENRNAGVGTDAEFDGRYRCPDPPAPIPTAAPSGQAVAPNAGIPSATPADGASDSDSGAGAIVAVVIVALLIVVGAVGGAVWYAKSSAVAAKRKPLGSFDNTAFEAAFSSDLGGVSIAVTGADGRSGGQATSGYMDVPAPASPTAAAAAGYMDVAPADGDVAEDV